MSNDEKPTFNNSGVDRERQHTEWYTCDRCGSYYPRSKMILQNGLYLCTVKPCVDKPGHSAATLYLDIPYEVRPEPLPIQDEDL
jgi:hypothetical protein